MPLLLKLLAQRIALGLVLLFLVSALIFAGTMILPGDVAQSILGQSATPEALEEFRKRFDIFYSRVLLAERMRNNAKAKPKIRELRILLDGFLPAIDGTDVELAAALDDIDTMLRSVEDVPREIALTSIAIANEMSQNERHEIVRLIEVMAAIVLVEALAGHEVLAAPVAAAPRVLLADTVLAGVVALASVVALAGVVATTVAAAVAGAPTSLACTSEEHAILTR